MTDMIEAEGLVKRFGRTEALRGVDLRAGRGTVLALLGPNGAGKSVSEVKHISASRVRAHDPGCAP